MESCLFQRNLAKTISIDDMAIVYWKTEKKTTKKILERLKTIWGFELLSHHDKRGLLSQFQFTNIEMPEVDRTLHHGRDFGIDFQGWVPRGSKLGSERVPKDY